MKRLLERVFDRLFAPVRSNYRHRNGVTDEAPRVEVPNDVILGLAREYLSKGHSATINVKGYSMRPFLEHLRDRVILERAEVVKKYDAVLAEISPGQYVLHRVMSVEGEAVTLMGDGNVRGMEHCSLADIAGVVTAYVRPKRTIQANNFWLRVGIRVWHYALPVR
ncbi:MAG: S24/S26 family peptidase, partial [Bacteroidaceae bacterium]|nr:S24/S26 family peptidase [Bacteroidaceae bacterium]